MKLSSTQRYAGVAVLAILLASVALGSDVFADTGDLRGRGSTGRTVDLTPPPPPPAPTPTPAPVPPPPPPSSGGISNTTTSDVDSGNNQGSNVETGDESAEVHVVNEGPTNTNTTVTQTSGGIQSPPPSPPAPEPTCDGRTREGCTQNGSRTR